MSCELLVGSCMLVVANALFSRLVNISTGISKEGTFDVLFRFCIYFCIK